MEHAGEIKKKNMHGKEYQGGGLFVLVVNIDLIKFMICHITELSSCKYQYEEDKILNNTTFKEYPHIKTGMITS